MRTFILNILIVLIFCFVKIDLLVRTVLCLSRAHDDFAEEFLIQLSSTDAFAALIIEHEDPMST